MIKETIESLETTCNARVLSGIAPVPSDIDILIQPQQVPIAREILASEGFVLTHDRGGKLHAQRFESGELYFLDIAYTFEYLEELFPNANLSSNLRGLVSRDPLIEKFLRYIYLFRGEEKHRAFMQEHFNEYREILFEKKYVGTPIVRRSLTIKTTLGMMQKRPLALMRGLTSASFASLLTVYLKRKIQRIGSGSIVAVVGSDGAGKTTVIDRLKLLPSTKTMYMGDWGFALQPLYNRMHDQHIAIARLTYGFFYVENWIRYLRAWMLTMRGITVLVDRYPGLNRHLRRSDLWLRLNDLLYRFFPSAGRYIFISADPSEVHRRKPELSVSEITELQRNMRIRLAKKNYIEIENKDLDTTLNTALTYLYTERP